MSRTYVITGSASGIGAAAYALLEQAVFIDGGSDVVLRGDDVWT